MTAKKKKEKNGSGSNREIRGYVEFTRTLVLITPIKPLKESEMMRIKRLAVARSIECSVVNMSTAWAIPISQTNKSSEFLELLPLPLLASV